MLVQIVKGLFNSLELQICYSNLDCERVQNLHHLLYLWIMYLI